MRIFLGKPARLGMTYAPVGQCIYCGAKEWSEQRSRKLGDEHIVPEGLGGRIILPEASCKRCEEITSNFELECLRGAYYTVRVQKGLGKRKRRVPRFVNLQVRKNGKAIWQSVPIEKYPAMAVTLLFDKPEILSDCAPVEKQLSGGVAIGILPSFGQLLRPYWPENEVSWVPPRNTATSEHLGRMLAKIAHSYAVAEVGVDGFKPFLKDIVLGTDTRCLGHYVGGVRDIPQAIDDVYDLRLATVKSTANREYLMVTIRLLSDVQGMPEYWIVVGEPSSCSSV